MPNNPSREIAEKLGVSTTVKENECTSELVIIEVFHIICKTGEQMENDPKHTVKTQEVFRNEAVILKPKGRKIRISKADGLHFNHVSIDSFQIHYGGIQIQNQENCANIMYLTV